MVPYAGYTAEDNQADFSPSDNPRQCPDYLGGSKDYFIKFFWGVRCVKTDWICSEERLRRTDRVLPGIKTIFLVSLLIY